MSYQRNMVGNESLYDFEATLKHETDKAFLLSVDGEDYWFAKALTEDNGDGTFTCPEWLAIEKGLE